MRKHTGLMGVFLGVLVIAALASVVTVWTGSSQDANVVSAPTQRGEEPKSEPRRQSTGPTNAASAGRDQEEPKRSPQVRRAVRDSVKSGGSGSVSGGAFAQALDRYEEKRQSVFFDKDGFVARALAQNTVTPKRLADVLKADRLPASSAIGDHLMEKPGPEIVQRMNALDLLEEIARRADRNPQAAEKAAAVLESFVTRRLPEGVSEKQLRLLVAEKDDALTKLGRLDPGRAVARWKSLQNGKLKQILRSGVLRGLVDSGVALEKAQERLALR